MGYIGDKITADFPVLISRFDPIMCQDLCSYGRRCHWCNDDMQGLRLGDFNIG